MGRRGWETECRCTSYSGKWSQRSASPASHTLCSPLPPRARDELSDPQHMAEIMVRPFLRLVIENCCFQLGHSLPALSLSLSSLSFPFPSLRLSPFLSLSLEIAIDTYLISFSLSLHIYLLKVSKCKEHGFPTITWVSFKVTMQLWQSLGITATQPTAWPQLLEAERPS